MSKVVYEPPQPRYLLQTTNFLYIKEEWIAYEGFDYLHEAERSAKDFVLSNPLRRARVIDTWAPDD